MSPFTLLNQYRFRWVSCQLEALEKCLDPVTLRTALRSLPKDLDETYARILKNLPREHEHHTIRLLQFLVYSERPLRINEAMDAIAVDLNERPRFKPENRMPAPDEILSYCSSLAVRVERKAKHTEATIAEIQLAHFSVKDYLTSNHIEERIAQHFKETIACSSIAEVCLAYLLELEKNLPITEIRQSFFLAQYAARYWASYAVIAERDGQMDIGIMTEFILDSSAYTICYQLYNPGEIRTADILKASPILDYVSYVGLSRCVRFLLDKGVDTHAQGGRYGNALQAASAKGHKEVVQLLLDAGADVNMQGEWYGNALQAASIQGCINVVQLLLDAGANVNAQGGYYIYAIYAAANEGHEKVIQLLLDAGADVKKTNKEENEVFYEQLKLKKKERSNRIL